MAGLLEISSGQPAHRLEWARGPPHMFAHYTSYHHCTVFAGSDATKLPTAPPVVPRLMLKCAPAASPLNE